MSGVTRSETFSIKLRSPHSLSQRPEYVVSILWKVRQKHSSTSATAQEEKRSLAFLLRVQNTRMSTSEGKGTGAIPQTLTKLAANIWSIQLCASDLVFCNDVAANKLSEIYTAQWKRKAALKILPFLIIITLLSLLYIMYQDGRKNSFSYYWIKWSWQNNLLQSECGKVQKIFITC